MAEFKCHAIQYSDQMVCRRCVLSWDTNDMHPPACHPFDHELHGKLYKPTPMGNAMSRGARALAYAKAKAKGWRGR